MMAARMHVLRIRMVLILLALIDCRMHHTCLLEQEAQVLPGLHFSSRLTMAEYARRVLAT